MLCCGFELHKSVRSKRYLLDWVAIVAWDFAISSKHGAADRQSQTRQLMAFLHAVRFLDEHGPALGCRSEGMSTQDWASVDSVAAEIEREQLRDDAGAVMPEGTSRGAVQGYLGGAEEPVINLMWSIGGSHEVQFNAVGTVYSGDVVALEAHSAEWLARFISSAAASVDAYEAWIDTPDLADALIDARPESAIGAVTLARRGTPTPWYQTPSLFMPVGSVTPKALSSSPTSPQWWVTLSLS